MTTRQTSMGSLFKLPRAELQLIVPTTIYCTVAFALVESERADARLFGLIVTDLVALLVL